MGRQRAPDSEKIQISHNQLRLYPTVHERLFNFNPQLNQTPVMAYIRLESEGQQS
jgi:hypothetical protein